MSAPTIRLARPAVTFGFCLGLFLSSAPTSEGTVSSLPSSGGGRSEGAGWVLEGTVGAIAPGTSGGGNYELAGGFWPAVLRTPPMGGAPEIEVALSGRMVRISWPGLATGWTLEQTASLNPGALAWRTATPEPVLTEGRWFVQFEASPSPRFFRLHQR